MKLVRGHSPVVMISLMFLFFVHMAVSLLVTIGLILNVSNTILGLTVLAWGNSLGDLVADVAVSKDGFPAMGVAAAYAGPMFSTCSNFHCVQLPCANYFVCLCQTF